MSIGVDGQYILSFSVGIYSDFLNESDLIEFTITEAAGNILPTYELAFYITDDRFLGILTETNDIKLSFGKTENDRKDINLSISSLDSSSNGHNKRTVILKGFTSNTEYLYNSAISISEKKSGIEVIKDVIESYNFIADFNVEKSEDSQRWVRPNITAKKYVNEIWLHSDIPSSFIATAITSEGKFILRDMKKLLEEDFKWRFTPSLDADNDIPYDPNTTIESKTGFINYWAGYGQNKLIFDFEDEDFRFISQEARPVIALTKEIARKASIEKRYLNTGMQNDNVHKNYWQASLRNLTNLVIFGSIKLTVTFRDQFRDIQPLDKVMFRELDVADPNLATEFHSGLYIVSSVSRHISNRQLITTVELNRESFNQVVGDVRQSLAESEEDEGFTDVVENVFDDLVGFFTE